MLLVALHSYRVQIVLSHFGISIHIVVVVSPAKSYPISLWLYQTLFEYPEQSLHKSIGFNQRLKKLLDEGWIFGDVEKDLVPNELVLSQTIVVLFGGKEGLIC